MGAKGNDCGCVPRDQLVCMRTVVGERLVCILSRSCLIATRKGWHVGDCVSIGASHSVSTVLVQDHFYSDYALQDNILNSHLHP